MKDTRTELPFTIHRSPFTRRYPFSVFHDRCLPAGQAGLMANGKCPVNGKWQTVNASKGGVL